MSYPIVSTPVATGFATSVTSMAVNLPASISSGDLLIAYIEQRNNATYTAGSSTPTGWTALASQQGGGSAGYLRIWYRIADGSEGATATWTASVATTAVWQVRKISGWHGSSVPEVTTASGDASSANPPSLTPSWGADDTLWLAIAGHAAASTTAFSGAPSGYSGFQNDGASSGGAAVSLASAYRELNTGTQDPAAFSINNNRWWTAATIAIRPAPSLTLATGTPSGIATDSITITSSGVTANPDALSVTGYGIAYGTSQNPTISNNTQVGTGTESNFSNTLTGLNENTMYYMRAYASWSTGTSYGPQVSYKTQGRPSVALNTLTTVSSVRPSLSFIGTDADNERITYQLQLHTSSTFTSPLLDKVSATDAGFTNVSTIQTDPFYSGNQIQYDLSTDLNRGTTYYWRVRGKDPSGSNTWGEWSTVSSFTVDAVPASLTTNGAANVDEDSADILVTVNTDGGATITERGVVYGTATNPTTADTKLTDAGSGATYTVNLTGLTGATTYYARAYAINAVGTAYGNNVQFQTAQLQSTPTVITGAAAAMTDTTSEFNGNEVTLDGGSSVTERGVVFSDTETMPTTDDRKVAATTAGLGIYNVTFTGLDPETTYYARAYAVSAEGTGYGDVETFTTTATPTADEGDGYWTWSPGESQATVGRTQSTGADSSVNLPLVNLGLTSGLQYTFYYGSVDASNGTPKVVIERFDGATRVEDVITAATPFTFTYDSALTGWHIRLFVTDDAVAETITTVFNDMYLAQEAEFSSYVPFTPRGTTEVKIVNNQIVDNRRDELIESMFDQVNGVSWYPFEIATEGLGYFEVGDRFTIVDDQDNEHSVVVWNTRLTMDGGIKEVLYTNKPDITETNYSKAGNSRLRGNIRTTTLQVDKQQGTIDALVSNMYNFDGIVNTLYSEVKQDLESVTTTVQGAGGSNLLQNSVMFAFDDSGNPDSWTLEGEGTLRIQASTESLAQGAVSGNQFTLQNMTVRQQVTVRKDVDFIDEEDKLYYALGARVKKNTVGTAWIKLTNRNETLTLELPDQTSYYWDTVSLEGILPLDDYYEIEIYSDDDADLQVTDLMFSPGKDKKQWSQANGEVMNSSVAVTKDGITIRSSAFQNNYTKIDALGFEVHKQSADGDRIFGFNDDETNISKLKADEQISMAPVRMVPINYGTYKGWAFTLAEDN